MNQFIPPRMSKWNVSHKNLKTNKATGGDGIAAEQEVMSLLGACIILSQKYELRRVLENWRVSQCCAQTIEIP